MDTETGTPPEKVELHDALSCWAHIAIWGSLLFVLVFAYLTPQLARHFAGKEWQDRGLFGDTFGVANALFSGLAFWGVVIAIQLQRRDLKIQSEDMRRSAVALEGRLNFERMQTKKSKTLALFDEYHSANVRDTMTRALTVMGKGGGNRSLEDLAGCSVEDTIDVATLLHFFEKCSVLQEAGEIDGELGQRLLGPYFQMWWDIGLRSLCEEAIAAQRLWPEVANALTAIAILNWHEST